MKTKLSIIALAISIVSCTYNPGETKIRLKGNETSLPEELKGLKVYSVEIENGTYIKVAVMADKVNSTTYKVGKYDESLVIVNKQNNKVIPISSILMENDSLIICKK